MLGPEKVLGRKKILSKKNLVPKHFWVKKICRGGSKLWAVAPWTIGSLHTKSWPPTMPGTLQKVSGGWWVVLTPNLVFCFGPKLWFWPRPKLNKNPLTPTPTVTN